MNKLNCIIVDDESNALDVLETYIARLEYLTLVGRCADAVQAMEVMQAIRVDAIFLDIDLPELSGIDFLRSLNPKPKVIFTTAYREHAIEAFELNAVDYLLKPFSFERFSEATKRLLPEDSTSEVKHITVYHDRQHVNVDIESISYVQAMGNYVKVYTSAGMLITHESIASLLSKLPQKLFIQVHKSYIVNQRRINAYTSQTVTINRTDIPVGRMFKKNIPWN
jgi:DNA-binding LytR/AlgR family response regulator